VRTPLFLLALVPTLAPGLSAQAPGGGASTVGTVYDSVRLRPLAGARIRLDSSDLVAIADADGRFRMEGIPAGPHYFRVEHPILDTLGISLRSATQTLGATDTARRGPQEQPRDMRRRVLVITAIVLALGVFLAVQLG
jgi:hypothetical protein